MNKNKKVLVLVGFSVAIYFFLLWSLIQLYLNFELIRPWVDSGLAEKRMLLSLAPLLAIGVTSFCMILEHLLMKDAKKSTFALIFGSNHLSNSIKNDLFYFLLRISGLTMLISFLLSGGTFYFTTNYIGKRFAYNLIGDMGLIAQITALIIVESVAFYFGHRLMHTRFFWEIHKVHHSATEYNVLLPYRNHPIDYWAMGIVFTFFHALAGGSFVAIIVTKGLNTIYQSMVHSRVTWPAWLDKILITPQAHLYHHSADIRHRNCNLGTLCIWDKIFGTYMEPLDEKVAIGVEDTDVNTSHYILEFYQVIKKWFASLAGELKKAPSV